MIKHSISTVAHGLCLAALMMLCGACSHMNFYRNSISQEPFLLEKERPLGTVDLSGSKDDLASDVHLYKIHKGYALKSHIASDANHSSSMIISKDKHRRLFTGFEWKWNF